METLSPQDAGRKAIDLLRAGRRGEAEAVARKLLEINPKDHTALYCLGLIAQSTGRHQDAVDLIGRAIAAHGKLSEYPYNLSISLAGMGRNAEAIEALREAIRLEPNFQLAHANLGGLLLMAGDLDAAEPALRRAVEINPREASAHANLGKLLRTRGRMDEAEAEYRAAIAIVPTNPQPWNMLGSCLREMGRAGEAINAFRSALNLMPGLREAFSNLCYAMHLMPGISAAQIAAEHREYGRRFAEPLRDRVKEFRNTPDPERRLRVGYVSPDFRGHCQTLFTLPLFEHHDRSAFNVFCYSSTREADAFTEKVRGSVDQWRDISALDDDRAADLIRLDEIDILVDLTLHMAGNRLPVFARKPAPLQFTWLGYPSTTGVWAIDYRISDPHLDPPGTPDEIYTEKTFGLPNTFWCYRPFDDAPEVNALPAQSAGHMTFGCFNSFAKVNDTTLELWGKVLAKVPDSRMVIRVPEGSARYRVSEAFSKAGIGAERVRFVDRQPQRTYMELYHQVDIALDTTPYTGHTTTLDALYMGVPVVTLRGETAVSRGSESILKNVGLHQLVTDSAEGFVKIAGRLTRDLPRLADLRGKLRSIMRQSHLMNEAEFTRDMEALYRYIWHQWCEKR